MTPTVNWEGGKKIGQPNLEGSKEIVFIKIRLFGASHDHRGTNTRLCTESTLLELRKVMMTDENTRP